LRKFGMSIGWESALSSKNHWCLDKTHCPVFHDQLNFVRVLGTDIDKMYKSIVHKFSGSNLRRGRSWRQFYCCVTEGHFLGFKVRLPTGRTRAMLRCYDCEHHLCQIHDWGSTKVNCARP
jgi:hypothetical protein